MVQFSIRIKAACSMRQVEELFSAEKKIIFSSPNLTTFVIEAKSWMTYSPLTPRIIGEIDATDINFRIKMVHLVGWIALTIVLSIFFWKRILKEGISVFVMIWGINVINYIFKRRYLIKKIYSVFERIHE